MTIQSPRNLKKYLCASAILVLAIVICVHSFAGHTSALKENIQSKPVLAQPVAEDTPTPQPAQSQTVIQTTPVPTTQADPVVAPVEQPAQVEVPAVDPVPVVALQTIDTHGFICTLYSDNSTVCK